MVYFLHTCSKHCKSCLRSVLQVMSCQYLLIIVPSQVVTTEQAENHVWLLTVMQILCGKLLRAILMPARLYQAIISKWENHMPPSQPLSLENRTKIRVWIEQGAIRNNMYGYDRDRWRGWRRQSTYVARACFTRDILPVIISHCATTGCHDAITHKEGYNYTTYANIMNVSNSRKSRSKQIVRELYHNFRRRIKNASVKQSSVNCCGNRFNWKMD